jgi:hypothetical protein
LLNLPLDVLIVRKIGFPGQEELAAGAVSETGSVVLNKDIVSAGGLSEKFLQKEIDRQKQEIARRVAFYRAGRRLAGLEGKVVILVDDGVATGATVKAAIATLKAEKIAKLVWPFLSGLRRPSKSCGQRWRARLPRNPAVFHGRGRPLQRFYPGYGPGSCGFAEEIRRGKSGLRRG